MKFKVNIFVRPVTKTMQSLLAGLNLGLTFKISFRFERVNFVVVV